MFTMRPYFLSGSFSKFGGRTTPTRNSIGRPWKSESNFDGSFRNLAVFDSLGVFAGRQVVELRERERGRVVVEGDDRIRGERVGVGSEDRQDGWVGAGEIRPLLGVGDADQDAAGFRLGADELGVDLHLELDPG